MRVIEFEETPNPDAIKCVLDAPLGGGRRSYTSPEQAQAAEDTLAQALFEVEGVRLVMLLGAFATIGKEPGARWNRVRAGVQSVFAGWDGPA